MCALKISLFGCLHIAAEAAPAVKATPVSEALLAYLLLQPRRLCPREQVMAVFWGDQDQQSARKCLNSTVWRLRRALEPEEGQRGRYLISTDRGELGFNWTSDYWLDIECFAAQIEPILRKPVDTLQPQEVATVEQTLALYQGDLLEGYYTDWALLAREQLRRLYLNTLAHLMHYYADNHSGPICLDKSLAYGQQILDLDPLREEIHRAMMKFYLQNGQRALAVRQYERCCELLERELDVPPMAETQLLFQQVLKQSPTSRPTGTVMPPPAMPTKTPLPTNQAQALDALQLAMHRFDEARTQLQQAIQLVERYGAPPH